MGKKSRIDPEWPDEIREYFDRHPQATIASAVSLDGTRAVFMTSNYHRPESGIDYLSPGLAGEL